MIGCSENSGPSAPHQQTHGSLEVGSVIDGRYHVVKKHGERGAYQFFAVEQTGIESTLIAPAPKACPSITGRLPLGTTYVVVTTTDDELRELLAGVRDPCG